MARHGQMPARGPHAGLAAALCRPLLCERELRRHAQQPLERSSPALGIEDCPAPASPIVSTAAPSRTPSPRSPRLSLHSAAVLPLRYRPPALRRPLRCCCTGGCSGSCCLGRHHRGWRSANGGRGREGTEMEKGETVCVRWSLLFRLIVGTRITTCNGNKKHVNRVPVPSS